MRSKFSVNIIGPIVCFFLLLFAIIFCAFAFYLAGIEIKFIILVDLIPFTIIVWVFYGEFRTKMIVAVLGKSYVIIVGYGGAGTPKRIEYAELDGYSVSVLSNVNNDYLYLYFVKDGKKIAKISQFYHSNYAEMKSDIAGRLKYLGESEFNYWQEIRESFT
jgi:hypothetical protein